MLVIIAAVDGGAIPFNTQFFHDEYDDTPGFDDVDDGVDGDLGANVEPAEQDLLAATQGQTRRVRPDFVNYAKRAKRVDVRKLKENIWKGLNIKVPEEQGEDDMVSLILAASHLHLHIRSHVHVHRLWMIRPLRTHMKPDNSQPLFQIFGNRIRRRSWQKSVLVSASFVFSISRMSRDLSWKSALLMTSKWT